MSKKNNITIKDVAKQAGVSISVVSYVLNDTPGKTISRETRERVFEAAKQLNYVPNKIACGMRRKKAFSLGVVSYWDIEGSVFMAFLSGISSVAGRNNYSVVFCNNSVKQDNFNYINYYLDKTVDGIIFISPHESLGSINESLHIAKMKQANVPFVIMNGHTNEKDVSYINIDFEGSTYIATRYLIEKGHKDIVYVSPFSPSYMEIRERYNGYCRAMAEEKLIPKAYDVSEVASNIKDFKAVVTNKSDTAHTIMVEALKQNLSIPDDFVIIAGNTESYSEYLFPPLSTVMIPAKKMGETAAEKLLDIISGDTKPVTITHKCSLQIRGSC